MEVNTGKVLGANEYELSYDANCHPPVADFGTNRPPGNKCGSPGIGKIAYHHQRFACA